jgi:uncharacterized protein with NAD-binding domain and iron-sulfur cluster
MQGGGEHGGQYLVISLSGADEYSQMTDDALKGSFLTELGNAFPEARKATVVRSLVTREHRATFRPMPGTAGLRPSAGTPVENLLLAGDWTDTGWPSTMEGAVLSGNKAADSIISSGESA